MTARIAKLMIEQTRVTATEAVLMVAVRLDAQADGVELRGKLVGPNRPGHATIAVAFPFRQIVADGDTLKSRVVIPEPNLWTPQAPFDYNGLAELWQHGTKVDERRFTVELKAK